MLAAAVFCGKLSIKRSKSSAGINCPYWLTQSNYLSNELTAASLSCSLLEASADTASAESVNDMLVDSST